MVEAVLVENFLSEEMDDLGQFHRLSAGGLPEGCFTLFLICCNYSCPLLAPLRFTKPFLFASDAVSLLLSRSCAVQCNRQLSRVRPVLA